MFAVGGRTEAALATMVPPAIAIVKTTLNLVGYTSADGSGLLRGKPE